MEHKTAQSFGIIPVFEDYNGYKILVVQNRNGGHWGFPKGTPEAGESSAQTAIRELQEETGIEERAIRVQSDPVFTEQYSFEKEGVIYDKTNTYHIGFTIDMNVGGHLDDISDLRWVSVEQAKELFTFKAILEVANHLEEHLESLQEYNW